MRVFIRPDRLQWPSLTRRVNRNDALLEWRVSDIVGKIRDGGDQALEEVIKSIEGFVPDSLRVTEEEFDLAEKLVPEELKEAITLAASRIRAFHELEKPVDSLWDDGGGIICRRRFIPLRRVGLYVPGGTAPLFSTVLMLGIPSSVAGCKERILFTPPGKDGGVAPAILFAAKLCGITEVVKVGGAQAVAAMAYGTQTIRKVDKIFGPGNRYVLKAKQIVSKEGVAVDMPAGPSEVLVIADKTAKVPFIVADLLSQAEHGPDSQVILVCPNVSMVKEVQRELEIQKERLPRKEVIDAALTDSRIVVFDTLEESLEFADFYAPEHLILAVEDPESLAMKVNAAGSVFLGHYAPESAGDYASGTNHILPTRGTAVAWSGIGVEAFMRALTIQEISEEGLSRIGKAIITMAQAEGLEAHASAVKVRMDYKGD